MCEKGREGQEGRTRVRATHIVLDVHIPIGLKQLVHYLMVVIGASCGMKRSVSILPHDRRVGERR